MTQLSHEAFASRISGYASQAADLAAAVISKAIANPSAGIDVHASVMDFAKNEDDEIVTERSRLAGLWRHPELTGFPRFEADAPLDNARLGLSQGSLDGTFAWVYRPADAFDALYGQPAPGAPGPEPATNWSLRGARFDPRNLVTPNFQFITGRPIPGLMAETSPQLFMFLLSPSARPGTRVLTRPSIATINEDHYRHAQAPAFSQQDAEILARDGLYGLHDYKIRQILRLMASVAGVKPPQP